MSFFNNIVTYELLVGITKVLGFTAVSIFTFAITNRFFTKQEKQYRRTQQEKILPLIYRHLGGENCKVSIQKQINNNWYSALAFQEVAFEMIEELKGSYREKISDLLMIQPLYNIYKQNLASLTDWKKLDALYYFRHLNELPDELTEQLLHLLNHRSVKIAHSSASALMRSPDVVLRRDVLVKYSNRRNTPQQSFLELLYDFHRPDLDQSAEESEIIPLLLFSEELKAELKVILLRCAVPFGYINQGNAIHDFLEYQLQSQAGFDSNVLAESIKVLGKFYHIRSAPLIRSLATGSPFPEVRKSSAFALGKFGMPEDQQQLVALLKDEIFEVRYESAKMLAAGGGQADELLGDLTDKNIISGDNILFDVIREKQEREKHRFLSE